MMTAMRIILNLTLTAGQGGVHAPEPTTLALIVIGSAVWRCVAAEINR